MKHLQKHWQWTASTIFVLGLVGAFWWQGADRGPGAAAFAVDGDPPAYKTMDRTGHDKVVTLIADIRLDRDALVALNLTSGQAESIVSAVRTWHAQNEAMLDPRHTSIGRKVGAVRQIERAIAMGPMEAGREDALALARQDLIGARATHRSALAPLESSLETLLSESQRATWTAIKVGHGQRMPIRMLALSDRQRLAYSDAWHRYRRQRAAAHTGEEQSAALATWKTALDRILTPEQATIVQAYNGYYEDSSAAVSLALETVLPVDQG